MLETYWGKCVKEEGMVNCFKYCQCVKQKEKQNFAIGLKNIEIIINLNKSCFLWNS